MINIPTYKYQNVSVTGSSTIRANFDIPEGEIIIAISIHCKYDGFKIISIPYVELDTAMIAPYTIESEDYDSMFEVWGGGNFCIVLTDTYASTNEITVKVVTLNKRTQEHMKKHGLKV